MPVPQADSLLEKKLLKQVESGQISSPNQFETAVMKIFQQVCGEYGKQEFLGNVVPALRREYVNSPLIAVSRAWQIIDGGASKKPHEIGEYFSTVLQKTVTKGQRSVKSSKQPAQTAEKSKSGYKPQTREPLEFSPFRNQDKLGEGLLKTINGNYVPMKSDFMITAGSKSYRFGFKGSQDRLSEGLVKFHCTRFLKGGGTERKEEYIPIEQLKKMKTAPYENIGCFVATAIYGSPDVPEVQILRDIVRDKVLMQNPLGRIGVKFYYSGTGRKVADFIEKMPSATRLLRRGLDLLVEKYSARKN